MLITKIEYCKLWIVEYTLEKPYPFYLFIYLLINRTSMIVSYIS